MSIVPDDQPTVCDACSQILFAEDGAIHRGCVTKKEQYLFQMVSYLNSQVITMKKTFVKVDAVIRDLGLALNSNAATEDDVRPVARNVRQSTKDKTNTVSQQQNTVSQQKKKKGISKKAISPLVLPNETSEKVEEIVISFNKEKTSVQTKPSEQSTPSSSTSSSVPSTSSSVPEHVPEIVRENIDVDTGDRTSELVDELVDDVIALPVVPPPKSIFLSRIGADVSAERVHNYIMSNVQGAENISIRKLRFHEPRNYSSFEIKCGIDLDLFNALLEPTVWPQHSIVHEFKRFLKQPRTYSQLQ